MFFIEARETLSKDTSSAAIAILLDAHDRRDF
jgi:hypothetical protein